MVNKYPTECITHLLNSGVLEPLLNKIIKYVGVFTRESQMIVIVQGLLALLPSLGGMLYFDTMKQKQRSMIHTIWGVILSYSMQKRETEEESSGDEWEDEDQMCDGSNISKEIDSNFPEVRGFNI
jgi:hypothetical protein